jgi:hypothetical protein
MAEPKRVLTIRDVEIDGVSVRADELVWMHGEKGDSIEVEYRDHRGRIPADAVVPYPVRGPALEELRKLDPCFGLPDEAFVVEHMRHEHLYELLRCRAHGRRFLRDTRGTFAWYSLTTLLRDEDDGPPDDLWARYHWMSDSRLMLEGRTR